MSETVNYADVGLDDGFELAVNQYVNAQQRAKEADQHKKEHGAVIRSLIEHHELTDKVVRVDRATVAYIAGRESKELDPQVLLREGVPTEILEKAYVVVRSKPYVRVTVDS